MEKRLLGKSNILVSRLCFGGLTIGPLQANLSVDEGSRVIIEALTQGVNFIDTAELYETYPHIKNAIKMWKGERSVIATKSYAYSKEDAQKSLEKARRELDLDVIDIFLMHEQESELTLKGHREAYEYYLNEKAKGRILAVGVSTHNIEVVKVAGNMEEIDIIHPLINISGLGIGDGSASQMLEAIQEAFSNGKGIYSMKPLGGGNLMKSYRECMDFVMKQPFIHSIAMGMQSIEEVKMNTSMINGEEISQDVLKKIENRSRKLHIDFWCEGCGKCVTRCGQDALSFLEGKAVVDDEKCVLCGYCSSVCPQFAIKIF